MTSSRRDYLIVSRSEQELTLEELADHTDVHPGHILQLVEFGLLTPLRRRSATVLFRASVIPRLRRILRIRNDLGVNLQGIAIILDLLDEIERLRSQLEEMHRRMG